MLLVGAPTQLFNDTLESNMEDVRKVFRINRVPHAPIPSWVWKTWAGAGLYLILAAAVYGFLDPTFPGSNWPLVLWTGVLGLMVGTVVMALPGDLYVRRYFHSKGSVEVAQWTIFLAAACVILTRVTGSQPGYVYGIIGALVFSAPLTLRDEGRMAFAGGVALLALALVAWFLRVPFQTAAGVVQDGPAMVIDKALATIFIEAISTLVFGLIPLRFLAGHVLRRWNPAAWLILWGVSITIFAHVILYPVSDIQPNPSAVGIETVAITVGGVLPRWRSCSGTSFADARSAAKHSKARPATRSSSGSACSAPTRRTCLQPRARPPARVGARGAGAARSVQSSATASAGAGAACGGRGFGGAGSAAVGSAAAWSGRRWLSGGRGFGCRWPAAGGGFWPPLGSAAGAGSAASPPQPGIAHLRVAAGPRPAKHRAMPASERSARAAEADRPDDRRRRARHRSSRHRQRR